MNRYTLRAAACLALACAAALQAASPSKGPLDLTVKNIHDEETQLSKYRGNVVLVVNVASQCGYTPQYKGLQALHEKHADQGFTVIGFPCNQFGRQEPGTHAEILEFCQSNYAVTFPMMAKIDVKGDSQSPVYARLTSHPEHGGEVKWNFEKFLIDRKGNLVGHFRSKVAPDDKELTAAIERELKKERP